MPADEDLPISGKDVRLELVFDGTVQRIVDQVVGLTENAKYTEIETKPIGSSRVYIDQEPEGWEGEIEVAQSTRQLESLIDAYHFNLRNRVPQIVNIVRTKYFRDGTSDTKVYPNVKVQFGSTSRRGQVGTIRLRWRTGDDRF